jgi:hypothetical protein
MMKSKHKRSLSASRRNKTASESVEYLYQINFRVPKNSIDSSLFIDFFVGNGPESEDPSTWLQDPNLIGSHAIVAMPKMPQVTITGVIILNHKLENMVAEGRLPDMQRENVLKMLQDNITWRIKTVCHDT